MKKKIKKRNRIGKHYSPEVSVSPRFFDVRSFNVSHLPPSIDEKALIHSVTEHLLILPPPHPFVLLGGNFKSSAITGRGEDGRIQSRFSLSQSSDRIVVSVKW